jgi:hypothetical protein
MINCDDRMHDIPYSLPIFDDFVLIIYTDSQEIPSFLPRKTIT